MKICKEDTTAQFLPW